MAQPQTHREWLALATVGTELAVVFAVFVGVGLLVDRWAGTLPAFTLLGAAVGFAGATWRLVRAALRIRRLDERDSKDGPRGREDVRD